MEMARVNLYFFIPSQDGSTALHQASFTGTIEMAALLLSLGADGLTRVSLKRYWYNYAATNTFLRILKAEYLFIGAPIIKTLNA